MENPVTLEEILEATSSNGVTPVQFRLIMHNIAVRIAKYGYLYKKTTEVLVKG